MSIHLSKSAETEIRRHGEQTFPYECCGFLYGREEGEQRIIEEAVPVDNAKAGDQRRRFEISPLDYLKAERYAEEHHTQLLGVYHSHPNHPAIASEHDLAQAMPYFSYVIVSVQEGAAAEIKSWKLKEGERRFLEEKIKEVNPPPAGGK